MSSTFHSSYAEARRAFLASARSVTAHITSYVHPMRGRDGEELATDVAVIGQHDAPKCLLISSGCHGVEGYCGSGLQIGAMQDPALLARCRDAGVTIIFAHALNPYGFSHLRRVTEDNVDLNRNFLDFARPLPVNEAYASVHPLLIPPQWPPDAANQRDLADWINTKGYAYSQVAVSGGQYAYPEGLFFGGHAPTWSNRTFRQLLRQHLAGARQLGWIDVHTGLGPASHGERISHPATSDHQRACRWWGGEGRTPLTTTDDGSSTSAVLTGTVSDAVRDECPQSHVSAIVLEFGTVAPLDILAALRADQWLQLHPEAAPETRASIKQQILAAFYIDTPQWQERILAQGLEAIAQGIDGLALER